MRLGAMPKRLHIINYLRSQLSLDNKTVARSPAMADGSSYPARYLKLVIDEYISDFL